MADAEQEGWDLNGEEVIANVNCPGVDTESSSVSATTRFFYDGQGNQVKRLDPDGSYTVYFFGMDEIRVGSNAGESIYYPGGGAMRVNGVLKFILSDQLGSTSVMTDASGVEQGRMGYYPFGKTRYSSPVERTGQAAACPRTGCLPRSSITVTLTR